MTDHDLDGVVAAPRHQRVILENERVRVLETRIPAGDTTPLHMRLAPTVMHVVSGSDFVRRDAHGATMVDTRADPGWVMPSVLHAESAPEHTIEDPSAEDLVVIGVELKADAVG